MKTKKPYMWVPSLYLGESLPFAAVMLMSVVLYQEMGLSDTQIALYTSWLGLPWVIKPLWSPFIDTFRTKRLTVQGYFHHVRIVASPGITQGGYLVYIYT